MKNIILLQIFICWSALVAAQNQYAITSSGKKVILKTDGTWAYVDAGQTTSNKSNNLRNSTNQQSFRSTTTSTKSSQGRSYIRGPRGGCYYINRNGNKTYVDRSFCQ